MQDPMQAMQQMMGQQQPPSGMDMMSQSPQGYNPLPEGPPVQEELAPAQPQGQNPASILAKAIQEANLAKGLDDEELLTIGMDVYQGFEADYQSVKPWLEANKEWVKMALLLKEPRSFPWRNASSAKFPLLATAAMQFSARAYPSLVPADGKLVKGKVLGPDLDEEKSKRAKRIADHMSYHLMYRSPDWEGEMDKLLYMEAITGVAFKKTYLDPVLGTVVSKVLYPEDLIINYWAKSIEDAYRKTEVMYLSHNEYLEKVRSGEFLDIDLSEPSGSDTSLKAGKDTLLVEEPAVVDRATPHVFLAQHTFYDLDEDGYAEPLVIIIEKESKKVVRIIARYTTEGIKMDKTNQKLVKIDPIEYFTLFQFIPSPDGSLYGQGLGALLGNINESVNSILNQLIDAGTLNNLQSGFIGKGLRIKMGQVGLAPGEWKVVNATGDDLGKSIFPLPSKEPSGVLFNLMNLLITSGNQLASVAEIMVGKMPGQNTPATTTQETVDQAMKVFTAVYKRNFKALASEFKKVYSIFRMNWDVVQKDAEKLELPMQPGDYDGPDDDIIPSADPTGDSVTIRMAKLQQVGQALQFGTINVMEFTKRLLEINEIPNPQALMQQPPPPPPDPAQMKAQADMQAKQQEGQLKQQMMQMEIQMKQMEAQLKQQEAQMKIQMDKQKLALESAKMNMDLKKEQQKLRIEGVKGMMSLKQADIQGRQKIAQNEVAFKQKQAQAKTKGESKPKEK